MNESGALKESLILQKRKRRFTKLRREGKLPFVKRTEIGLKCVRCGNGPHLVTQWVFDSELRKVPGSEYQVLVAVDMLDLEGDLWCYGCFSAHWCIVPPHGHGHVGSLHTATPRSDANYHGGQFNQGEW